MGWLILSATVFIFVFDLSSLSCQFIPAVQNGVELFKGLLAHQTDLTVIAVEGDPLLHCAHRVAKDDTAFQVGAIPSKDVAN